MPSNISFAEKQNYLSELRKSDYEIDSNTGKALVYCPEVILEYGEQVLESLPQLEKYAILEQLFKACLDIDDLERAEGFLKIITSKFPAESSTRVMILHGMFHEFKKEWSVAEQYYNQALEVDECNMKARKRKIALLISQNRSHDAIEALIEYTDTFMQDYEAWAQLSKLYLQENLFKLASFCLEELLLLQPQNTLYQIKYADLHVIMENYNMALKYYCLILETCDDNLRALYGLHYTSALLISKAEKEENENNLNESVDIDNLEIVPIETLTELLHLSKKRLESVYSGGEKAKDVGLANVIKEWLKK